MADQPPRLDVSSLVFTRLPSKTLPTSDRLLAAVKQAEKRTFPPNEAFDFDAEMKKRTTNVYGVHCRSAGSDGRIELCGYAVYVRSKLATRIHKVCVLEGYRRQGVGRWMMERLLEELVKASAASVDLWVDTSRIPARQLYACCGFHEMDTVRGYYSPTRDAVRMELRLDG